MEVDYSREVRNTNGALKALSEMGVDLKDISDTLNSFEELYHQDAVIFLNLCKDKECLGRAWKSLSLMNGKRYPGKFFAGIETKKGPIMRVFLMDDYDAFDNVKMLDHAPYDAPVGYTADKIASLK